MYYFIIFFVDIRYVITAAVDVYRNSFRYFENKRIKLRDSEKPVKWSTGRAQHYFKVGPQECGWDM